MQQQPSGWTYGDLQRFNAMMDIVSTYLDLKTILADKAPGNAFFQARLNDIATSALALGHAFENQFGT